MGGESSDDADVMTTLALDIAAGIWLGGIVLAATVWAVVTVVDKIDRVRHRRHCGFSWADALRA